MRHHGCRAMPADFHACENIPKLDYTDSFMKAGPCSKDDEPCPRRWTKMDGWTGGPFMGAVH